MLVFQCLSAQLPFFEDYEDKHHHNIIQNIAHSLAVSYDLMQRKEICFERLFLLYEGVINYLGGRGE